MKKIVFSLVYLVGMLAFMLTAVSSVQADTFAYIGYQTGAFGTIDLDTGVVNQINSSIGINPAGFGEVGGTLFTANYGGGSGTLYTVNTTTGALTPVGTATGTSYHDFGSTPTGLYADDFGNPINLYSVDPSLGGATKVGSTGLASTLTSYRALSTNSSTLYFAKDYSIYTLNTIDGTPTLVGSFGSNIVMTALLMVNGTLYGADESGNFYTINTGTGAATIDSSIPNVKGAVWALAPIISSPAPVPVPCTILLLGSGLIGFAGLRRKMKR
jgi:hypothetical protein